MNRLLGGQWRSCLLAAVLVLAGLPITAPVRAAVNSCNVWYTPDSVAPSREVDFHFEVHSGALVTLTQIMIAPPDPQYVQLQSGTADGFSAEVAEDSVSFYGGELLPHGQQDFVVHGTVTSQEGNLGPWSVYASDGNDMSLPCSGSMNLVVNAQSTGVHITNVGVTNVAQTGVTVTWQTDVPATSQVLYGATISYDKQTALDSRLTLDHRLNIVGLAPDTAYHFMTTSTVPVSGDSNSSLDNTFVTASVPPPIMAPELIAMLGVAKEAVPPMVTVSVVPAAPQPEPPLIAGTATDNAGVAAVDYSVDGGVTWRPVDSLAPTAGVSHVSYSFRPVLPEDGEYAVRVRATDTSGNVAASSAQTLIIDRLPPRFAGQELRLGSQPLAPDAAGRWRLVAGQDVTIWMNAVGGPVRATVVAHRVGSDASSGQQFSLRREIDSGLWHGVLALGATGTYDLRAVADDGAGNHTDAALGQVLVVRPGMITSEAGRAISGARLTLYYRAVDSGQWVVWDGSGYGQQNPRTVGAAGTVSLVVPSGTYYAEVEADGYQTQVSSQFTVNSTQVINPVFRLTGWPGIHWGWLNLTLPSWPVEAAQAIVAATADSSVASPLVGQPFPDMALPLAQGGTMRRVNILGHPTVISVMSTWSGQASEQEPVLERLSHAGRTQVFVAVLGERVGQVNSSWSSGNYQVAAIVDEHMDLTQSLGMPGMLTHYVVDREGVVRHILYGLVTQAQLEAAIAAAG